MDSQIAKKTQDLNTAEEMRNHTKLVMQPYANWEEYLTPAPLSIAILGELVFISSKEDFSINKNPPEGGYKCIKYPNSFRACLMQVCNSGWRAFNEAHKNMDQIRLHTMAVPDYMKAAVKILFQDDKQIVKALLPKQLYKIGAIADECLKLANSTEMKFTDVINIIQELLEACVNAKYFYGEELDAIKKNLEESKMRKQSTEAAMEFSEKAMKAMNEQLMEAQESYKNAMNSLPSGWDMIGMDAVSSLTESLTTAIDGFFSSGIQPGNLSRKASTTACCTMQHSEESRVDEIDLINIYSKSAEILKCTENVQKFVDKNTINWNELYDQKKKVTVTYFQKSQFERIKENLKKKKICRANKRAQHICDKGIGICKELEKYAPEGKCEDAKTAQLIESITNLVASAQTFHCKSKDITNSPALAPKPPMMYKVQNKSGKMSVSQRASENARYRIEQSRVQLDKTRETYDKCVKSMEENQKELTEILITMRGCKIKEIDFNTTIKMLVKGMDAMGRVKEQWEKMIRFFQMVSNIVKTNLTSTIKDFVDILEETQSFSYNAMLFSKDLIYTQAFKATNLANLVHMISGTYTEVSNKHIMDRVSSLGKLMVMDIEKPEFLFERQMLQNSCDEAQKAILDLVLKKKEEFEWNSAARMEKIDKELLAILPAAAPEEIKSIQAIVESGFTAEEEEDYA